jgi:8-oxo-dGTP pyrophosphatase MutT (NUDIX family)
MPDQRPAAVALDRIVPGSPEEVADLAILREVAASTDPWDRTAPLHLTGSALVLHPPSRRALLRWHDRQQAWIQVGGHGDPGEEDPLEVALREAREETGLTDLVPWPDADRPIPVHVAIVPVPARGDEPAHHHGDVRYLLATDRPDEAAPEDGTAALQWLPLDEAIALTGEDNVRITLQRAAERLSRPG